MAILSDKFSVHSLQLKKPLKLTLCVTLFLLAYCSQPILIQMCKYRGSASASTFIYLLPHTLGMVIAGAFPIEFEQTFEKTSLGWLEWKRCFVVAMIDLVHQLGEKAGLVLCGSGLYTVLSSSSIVWTALISNYVFKRYLNIYQWFGLILIVIGVRLKATEIEFHSSSNESIGGIITLLVSALQGLTFVINEKYMTQRENNIRGPDLVYMIGVINTIALIIWTCIWTIPRIDILVLDPIRNKGGDFYGVLGLMFLLLCSGIIHSSTLWYILQELGAVSSGVLKGCKTITVVFWGHFLFCGFDESECITPYKLLSAAFALMGVLSYSFASYYQEKNIQHNKIKDIK